MPQNANTNTETYGCLPSDYAPRAVACGAVPPSLPTPVSTLPRPPRSLLEWLGSDKEPYPFELVEALAKAMAISGKDYWHVGEDVMPPYVPDTMLDWLERAPAWPIHRPAREAWLTACVFQLSRDPSAWRQGSDVIVEDWARACVPRFLQMAGLLSPSTKDAPKRVDDTFRELQRLPWPGNRLMASEDPLAGWVRGALEYSSSGYVATAEVFAVWQVQNPGEQTTPNEFGERLAKTILAWRKADADCGQVSPIKNISRSCCREYPRGKRPRGWGGLTLRDSALVCWKSQHRTSLASCSEDCQG